MDLGRFLLPVLLCGAALTDAGVHHAKAVTTLGRLADGVPKDGDAIEPEDLSFDVRGATVPARIYRARSASARSAASSSPGIVLCHGIHRLGIDEPRLIRFARALAASGITVLTPRIEALTDYRIDAASVPTIGAASVTLAARMGRRRVGVMGFSFAGGLALIAASRAETSAAIGMVVAIGAHDELARVTTFFARGNTPAPHGATLTMQPHEYGPLVLAYGHTERFFGSEDTAIARDAIRLKLWEKHDEANERAKGMTPAGTERWVDLTRARGNRGALAPILEALAADKASVLAEASPHGKLSEVRVPIFLLHGAGDSVIPPTETRWIASQVPPEALREALVSPIIQHVEIHGKPTFMDQYALVRFLARVLAALEDV